MTRDRARPGRNHVAPWVGGLAVWLLLLLLTSVSARAQQLTSYAQCTRAYSARADAAAYCRRLFPAPAPPSRTAPVGGTPRQPPTPAPTSYDRCIAANGRSAEAQRLCARRDLGGVPVQPPPVDVTPPVNTWLDGLFNRPSTPTPPGYTAPLRTPADPLAVIPGIQAACAEWAGDATRWRRCTTDGWRKAGLRGEPPLALQTPPRSPSIVTPPSRPPVVPPDKPIQQDPLEPVAPNSPPVVATPPARTPPVATILAPPAVQLPPVVSRPPEPPPEPPPPAMPIWTWIVALIVAAVVAAAGGFGLAKLLERAKRRSAPGRRPSAAPLGKPDIALVADPGRVILEPDGPPRAGLSVSLRCIRAPGEVRLDYPLLESAP